jgi:hypothetical protein
MYVTLSRQKLHGFFLNFLFNAGETFGFCFSVRLERAPIVVLLVLGPLLKAEWLVN